MSAAYYEPSIEQILARLPARTGFSLVSFMLYFLFRFRDLSFGDYIHILIQTGKYVHVISLAVFSNLIPFMFFVRTNRFKSGGEDGHYHSICDLRLCNEIRHVINH